MKKRHSLMTGRASGQRSVSPANSRRRNRSARPTGLGARFEALEPRYALAANILAQASTTLDTAGGTREIDLHVDLPTGTAASTTAILMIETSAATNSTFDPAAAIVRTSTGTTITPMSRIDDANGTIGITTIALAEGNYKLALTGDGGTATTGAFVVKVSLLGDTGTADGSVGSLEQARASAALVQSLGTGNFVTASFYQSLGISLSQSQYDPGFDANGNGVMEVSDLDAVEHNVGLGPVTITLLADDDAPTITNVALTTDTGTSTTDKITTNPAITASVNDDSAIATLQARLDAGTNVDVLSSFNTTTKVLTLSQTVLNTIAGGTLAGGPHTLRLTATDSLGNAMTTPVEFTFTFIATDTQPQVTTIGPKTATEDTPFSLNITSNFTNNDTGDALTLSATLAGGAALPAWLTFNAATGIFSGTPLNANVGPVNITVTARDTQNGSASDTFTLTVTNVNDAPTLVSAIPNQTATEGAVFSFDIASFFTDQDSGNVFTYAAVRSGTPTTLPAWLSFNTTTGRFSGTPQDSDVGAFDVQVTATDSGGLSVNDTFTITVSGVNDIPVRVTPIADQTIQEDAPFTLNITSNFRDDDGDALNYSATLANGNALPSWLTLNATSGIFTGTPLNANVGTISVLVTVRDPSNASVTDTFDITVQNVNDAPVVENQTFTIPSQATNNSVVGTVIASDVDAGNTLTFSITGGTGAARFSINPTSGQVTLVDASNLTEGATFTFDVQVADSGTPALTDTAVITVNVSQNQAPVAVNDSGVTATDRESLAITAASLLANDTDAEGDAFTLTSVSATSAKGATVTLASGTITYNPTGADQLISLHAGANTTDTFTYTIQDGQGRSSSATVTVTVNGTDDVRFRLVATDTSGNPITQIQTGQAFNLLVKVQDVRPAPRTVFSAYLDITYPTSLTVGTAINHINPYTGGTGAGSNILTTAGLIDEAGAVSLNFALTGENDVFSVPFTAGTTPGSLTFTGRQADNQVQRPVTIVGTNTAIDPRKIDFGSLTLNVVGTAAPAGLIVAHPQQNGANALDVDNDGTVSPLDAVLVVNALTDGITAGVNYVDVDGDGQVSPMDALYVINGLAASNGSATSAPQAAMSAGAVRVRSTDNGVVVLAPNTDAAPLAAASIDSIFDEVDSELPSQSTAVADNATTSGNMRLPLVRRPSLNGSGSAGQSNGTEQEAVDQAFVEMDDHGMDVALGF